MHLAQHLFDDIKEKGVTRNYTTKTFEKMHGPLKDSYKRCTNFKNVGGQVSNFANLFTLVRLNICQILKAEHCAWISAFIRYQIIQLNEAKVAAAELTEDVTNSVLIPGEPATTPLPETEPHFTLGSKQSKSLVIGNLQRASNTDFDPAFTSFRSRVSRAIQSLNSQPTNAIYDSHEVLFALLTPVSRWT